MKSMLKSLLIIAFSAFVYQAGIVFFVLPSGLITGGTTGIALVFHHLFRTPIALFVAVFNAAMFLLGLFFLGKTFALTTLASTIFSPLVLTLLQAVVGDWILTDDPLLCSIFGGICIGASIAMVLQLGASTGGMDIPPLLLKKFFGLPVSVTMYVCDFLILLAQAYFCSTRHVLYGILLVLTYTITLDKMLALGDRKLQLEIVSDHVEEIKQAILSDVDRGVTLLHGQTGYRKLDTDMIICVIAPRERHRTEALIHQIDPHAFVILSQVTKVSGRGFTEKKKYLPPL